MAHKGSNYTFPGNFYRDSRLNVMNISVQPLSETKQPARNTLFRDKISNDTRDFKTIFCSLAANSSNYALSESGRSVTKSRKIFWILVFVFGLVGSMSQIGQFLAAYFNYPVVININIINLKKQQLPAVTICNMNIVRREFLPCLENKMEYDECNSTNVEVKSEETTEVFTDYPNISDFSSTSCEDLYRLGQKTGKLFKWITSFPSLSFESRIKYGHTARNFIHACYFNGRTCVASEFKLSSSYIYGNCFTFNSATENKSALNVQFQGPNYGLDLILNLESHKYIPSTDGVGARIHIHDPYHEPDIEDGGINLSPGFETSIALSKRSIIRLPAPYKDRCKKYGQGDSIEKCKTQCVDNLYINFCSCSIRKDTMNYRQCDFTSFRDACCIVEINEKECESECPLPCEETDFKMQVSSLVWPSKAFYNEYLESFLSTNISLNISSLEEFRESVLKVKIYFDTLKHKVYEQKPLYQSTDVLSQIGGQVSLWLGLSSIFLFECVINVLDLWLYERKRH